MLFIACRDLLGLGQAKEALPDVEKAIEIVPEEESSYLLRGRIHMALGDIEAANSDFQQVLDLNPFNEDACILSGQLLIEQKKYDEAIASLTRRSRRIRFCQGL